MYNRTYKIIIASVMLLLSVTAQAALDTNIVVKVEEPASMTVKSGITTLRGYAVTPWASFPIVEIAYYIDGAYRGTIPYGAARGDVGNAFPSYPNSDESGYAMAFGYNTLSAGSHTLIVRAIDSIGDYNQVAVSFTVTKMKTNFISNANSIDFLRSEVSLPRDSNNNIYDKTIYLENVFADNKCYDIWFDWNRSIQGWSIKRIQEIAITWCN